MVSPTFTFKTRLPSTPQTLLRYVCSARLYKTSFLLAIRRASLSNKGQLSAWKIHETADLNSICQTLHRSGITMHISDPLSA